MPKPSPSQGRKFEDAARELGCDESEERFDKVLKAVAKQKPKQPPTTPKARRK